MGLARRLGLAVIVAAALGCTGAEAPRRIVPSPSGGLPVPAANVAAPVVSESAPGSAGEESLASEIIGVPMEAALGLDEIAAAVAAKRVVYLGERHNRYGDHLVQLALIKKLHQIHPNLSIGMEMFQRRKQQALNDYLQGRIDEVTFLRQSNYYSTWRFNYYLYRDIVEFARQAGIPVLGLNIPPALAAAVARSGLEGLNPAERRLLPESMDFSDEAYRERLRQVFAAHQAFLPGGQAPQRFDYFYQAQVLWDESMAAAIASYLQENDDRYLVVLAGTGHLAFGSGIPRRTQRRTGLAYALVLPAPEDGVGGGFADYLVFPPEAEVWEPPRLLVSLRDENGKLRVSRILPGSAARDAGMQEGDLLLAIDGREISGFDDLQVELLHRRSGEVVKVAVARDGRRLDLMVELRPPPDRRHWNRGHSGVSEPGAGRHW